MTDGGDGLIAGPAGCGGGIKVIGGGVEIC